MKIFLYDTVRILERCLFYEGVLRCTVLPLSSRGPIGLIVMHSFKAYTRSTTTDIDRFTRYSRTLRTKCVFKSNKQALNSLFPRFLNQLKSESLFKKNQANLIANLFVLFCRLNKL